MTPMTAAEANLPHPGFFRHLLVMFYDSLLLLALLFAASVPVVMLMGGPPKSLATIIFFRLYLLMIWFAFLGGFWVHGGQTLGMRVWRVRLSRENGDVVNWPLALKRFVLSICTLGLGLLWMLIDKDNLSAYDRWSHTHLQLLPKNTAPGKDKD